MSEARRGGNYMLTFTGKRFYPEDIRPGDFCIEDIAHAISNLCRYGGHCSYFYSVAEHSCYVSQCVSKANALAGLMHDATEGYLVDMPRPIKVGFPQYKEMEASLWTAIAKQFGLPEELPQEVHDVDGAVLFVEREQLWSIPIADDWGMGRKRIKLDRQPVIIGWGPKFAEHMFMERYKELTR